MSLAWQLWALITFILPFELTSPHLPGFSAIYIPPQHLNPLGLEAEVLFKVKDV